MSYPESGASHKRHPKFLDDAREQEGQKDKITGHHMDNVTTRFPNSDSSEEKRAEDFVSANPPKGD